MREYQKFSYKNKNYLKGRMNSPPPPTTTYYCCSSGTASSSLSQPISLDLDHNQLVFKICLLQKKIIFGKPIEFDDLIYGTEYLNNYYWKNKNSLMMFSSSEEEDLTTSDSEICQNNNKKRIEENNKIIRFSKFPSLSTIYPNNNSSLSLNDSSSELLLKEGINNNLKQLNNKIQKSKQITPQRIPTLEMVEEISPVLPRPNPNEDFDVPPLPRPLQLIDREWHPLKTSTLANLQSLLPSKTNSKQKLINKRIISNNNNNMPQIIALDPPPKSLFDPFFPQQSSSSTTMTARPEQFNLPSALAKNFGIKGILFIQISVIGNSLLIVHLRNGALFLDNLPSSCYVKVEIRRCPSNRKRSKYDHRFCYKLSSEVHKLGISLYTTTFGSPSATIAPAAELLGRMSFSLRKFFRLAKRQQHWGGDVDPQGRQQSIQVCEGGFFLLADKLGQQSHLSQNNILHRKYYDEIGITGCSSISSNSSFGSPFKMMNEPEWVNQIVSSTLSRPNFLKNSNISKNKKNINQGILINCSNSSSSQSGVDCKRRALQQMNADSSDFTSSVLTNSIDVVNINSFNNNNKELNNNNNYLIKQLPPPIISNKNKTLDYPSLSSKQTKNENINNNNNKLSLSSTSSTELPLNNNNKEEKEKKIIILEENSVTITAPLTDKLQRKNQLGPIGRTLYFLKSKLDFSLSASILCPSKEECHGCMLFREFLQSEFSEENLDFWLDVENFKRMKDSKKQTLQKAQYIFDTYIKELAIKEVNLDSETRLKTKNGLQNDPIRTDIFNLAQSKIEQLMAKDSYPRFLKSEQYLDLLDDIPNVSDKPRSASNGLLRVSSTKSNGSNIKTTTILNNSRSPSLSPKLENFNGGRCIRRNTCSPVSPINLQIPSIREHK
ncbi:RGS domain-containing protein [Meloidogyne graminicola]|uniref:RGS domain-containing protein n=1 Tax=Meloidogyne graminicola TaxID=189291 RepID=A0A8S9ZYJ4_9BILA|nr:RGS domain-containing protein [Meloidogyne graminicola]